MQTLLWHDYETWGINPKSDFPFQFAAIRTDVDLNIIGDPIVLYAKPPVDRLPEPIACLVTEQTPQNIINNNCLSDVEFINQINTLMSEPNTCVVGYNNLRFDDEVTRFALFRNLFNPYNREWQNGCSRWDLLDVLRLARTLRPDGIEWPNDDNGKPSMKLENLTNANNIIHDNAHDALSDVYATIEMAKILKSTQPKLYDYAFNNRSKTSAKSMLNCINPQMILHISGMYSNERGNLAIIMPIVEDPNNQNAIAVIDLSCDIDILKSDDIEYLHYLLFTKQSELKKGEQRLPLKTVHINKCPVLSPLKTLNQTVIKQYNINLEQCENNFYEIQTIDNIADKIKEILSYSQFTAESNPELSLYNKLPSKQTMLACAQVHNTSPEQWHDFDFKDVRYNELFFRFKARNYPDLLDNSEKSRWQIFCKKNIKHNLHNFQQTLDELKNYNNLNQTKQAILEQLTALPEMMLNNV